MLTQYKPFLLVGPGDIIWEEIEARGWNQQDFSELINMSPKTINELISNKQAITFDIAQSLSKACGQSVQFWLNQEAVYREHVEKQKDTAIEMKAFPGSEVLPCNRNTRLHHETAEQAR